MRHYVIRIGSQYFTGFGPDDSTVLVEPANAQIIIGTTQLQTVLAVLSTFDLPFSPDALELPQ